MRRETESVYLAGREDAWCAIDDLRAGAWDGHGTGVLVQGAPGVGRTALLRAVCERAQRAGAFVVEAAADPLEADCPFGVVRQLLGGDDGPWSAAGPAELFERTIGLAAGRPLVVAVDDLRWADDASARWLAYLLRRIRRRQVLVVATASLPAGTIDAELLSRFDREITLGGLGAGAVTDIAGELLGTPVEKEFGEACHRATDGNPALLLGVLRALRRAGRPASEEGLNDVLASPRPEALTWLHRTLRHCGQGARELAEAVAVFGEPVDLDLAAATAGLPVARAAALADELAAARLLFWCENRVSLRPPLVRAAVRGGLAPGTRRLLHTRAARLLHAQGAPAGDIADQLLRSDPLGEPWAADVLCAVAAQATAEGAPDRALDCLRSALREPVDSRRRAELMVLMGSVQPPGDIGSAVGYLRRALDVTSDVAVRAGAARRLAGLLCLSERYGEGMSVLRTVAAPTREHAPDVALDLEVEEALLRVFHLPSPHTALDRLADRAGAADGRETDDRSDRSDRVDRAEVADRTDPAGGPEHDALGIVRSVRAMMSGRQRSQAVRLASRALDLGLPVVNEASLHHPMNVLTLAVAGELDLAARHADAAVAQARRTRSALGGARALAVRSEVNYRLGRLDECRSDAQACRETLRQFGPPRADGLAMAASARLVDVLVDKGDLDGAERVVADELAGNAVTESLLGTWLLAGRGRLHLARGRFREGVEDLRETGRRLDSWQVTNPAVIPWRSLAGAGYAALGKPGVARDLIDAELALARRWGSARAVGVALGAAGAVAKGNAAVVPLQEAVAVLARSDAALEHARSLADLGTALRRTNRLADARHHLRHAASSAEQCGATALVRHARAELIAAGARPRSRSHFGLDSLTPTERRVATLAARGLSNREISERLFVVRRTVELHLSSAYRKLGIRGRADLPARMPADRA
ncbi:AAA family ATPase [Streptomyces sp. NPDC047108]|uniref:helix-turn-helix transcriptional regulator n=1 Tax=Streptomyces sp. NPDC047108 TaxID=3155025 RepID=UPI0033C85839